MGRGKMLKSKLLGLAAITIIMAAPSYVDAQHGHGHSKASSHHGHQKHAPADVQAIQMEKIVVSGDKIDAFARQYPHQVVGLDAAAIRKRNFMNVYEALSALPGVDIKQSSGGSVRIAIRGAMSSGSVLILIDGRPANTSQYGGVDLSAIPIDMIKSVTVFKPPAPVWLGPGSSAGAIYIETLGRAKAKDVKTKRRVRLGGGSYGLFHLNGSGKFNLEKSSAMLAAGFRHRDGKRPNSDMDKGNLSANWTFESDAATQYRISGKYFHSDHGMAGPTYNATPNARQKYEKGSLDFKIKGFVGENSDYDIKLYGDVVALEDRANAGDIATMDLHKTGLNSEIVWSGQEDKHELRLGGLFEHTGVDQTQSGDHHRDGASMHIEHTRRFEHTTLTTGVRGDYTNDFGAFPGASCGVQYEITSDTLCKGNIGYSVDLPSFGQLYQPTHGSIDQVRGNPDLVEEQIISSSLDLEHTINKDNVFTLTLFHTDTRDLIQYQRGDDLISRPENINRAYKQGVETALKIKPMDALNIDANYIWQKTRNEDNGGELSYSPRHHGNLTIRYLLEVKTRLELTARAYSTQYTDTANTPSEKISGYLAVDAKMIQPVTLFGRSGELFLHADNLFDREYEVHYGYPDDGLRLTVGLALNF